MERQNVTETTSFFPEPETAPLDFGLPFTQKYQPKSVADFIGLGKPKAILGAILKAPRPCSLLFVGPPGTGKTTIAAAFAKELGAGMIHVASQSLTVELVAKTWDRVHYFPGTKSDWWVVQVDEAETMSYAAQRALLSHLDSTANLKPTFGGGMAESAPLKVIWIFTCNGRGPDGTQLPDTFEPRFLSRNLVVAFQKCNGELPDLLRAIWDRETSSSERVPDFGKMAQTAGGQVRDALQALEVAVLTQSYNEPDPPAPLVVEESPREAQEVSGPARSDRSTSRCKGNAQKAHIGPRVRFIDPKKGKFSEPGWTLRGRTRNGRQVWVKELQGA